jgi:ferredoxin-type protein NapG
MNICPEGIIYPLGIESGLINVYTPALDFEHGKCTFCNKCVDVCPTAIIAGVDPADTASGRIGVAEVLPERCLAYVASGSCGVCADACEYGALYLNDEHRPVVIEEKCNGCGACFVKCPANVLTSFSGGKERGINVVVES